MLPGVGGKAAVLCVTSVLTSTAAEGMIIGAYESWTLIFFFIYFTPHPPHTHTHPHLYALTLTSNGSLAGCPAFDPVWVSCTAAADEQSRHLYTYPIPSVIYNRFIFGFENDAPDYWHVHLHSCLFPRLSVHLFPSLFFFSFFSVHQLSLGEHTRQTCEIHYGAQTKAEPLFKTTSIKQIVQNCAVKKLRTFLPYPAKPDYMLHRTIR